MKRSDLSQSTQVLISQMEKIIEILVQKETKTSCKCVFILDPDSSDTVTLDLLADLINQCMPEESRNMGHTVKTKKRFGKLMVFKQLFSYFARVEYGYSLVSIAQFLGVHHSTILYNTERVRELLNLRDELITENYFKIKSLLEGIPERI